MHFESYREMARLADLYLDTGRPLQVLDVGSLDVNGSFRPLFERSNWVYRGLDMAPGPNVDIVVEHPYRWRLPRGSFDLVISGQALEHMPFFWLTWRSMTRLVRPGGLLFLNVPAKGPEHRYPVDCWRFYPDSMQALADYRGLELVETATRWEAPWGDTVGVFRKPARARSLLTKLKGILPKRGAACPATGDQSIVKEPAARPPQGAMRRTERLVAAYRNAYACSVADWSSYYRNQHHDGHARWMGAPVRGNPIDLWVYQEMLSSLRPDVVVMLGAAATGNLLFLLQMLDLIGAGILISVACDDQHARIDHPRLRRIDGNPASPAVHERVATLIGNASALVIRNGDQRYDAVLEDLRNYARLVTPGSYLIVEDGIDELVDGLQEVPPQAEGTLAAIMDFLEQTPDFEADQGRERYLITANPWGFLRRRALPEGNTA